MSKIEFKSFRLTSTKLEAIGDPTFEEWLEVGKFMHQAGKSLHFWLGDWLNLGERKWGEKYKEAIALTGFDYQTLRNDKWVARQVDLSVRKDNLSFTHHLAVAEFESDEQEELLNIAEKQKLTVKDFHNLIKQRELVPQIPKVQEPTKPDESILDAVKNVTDAALSLGIVLDACPFDKLSPSTRSQLFQTLKILNRRIDGIFMTFEEDEE